MLSLLIIFNHMGSTFDLFQNLFGIFIYIRYEAEQQKYSDDNILDGRRRFDDMTGGQFLPVSLNSSLSLSSLLIAPAVYFALCGIRRSFQQQSRRAYFTKYYIIWWFNFLRKSDDKLLVKTFTPLPTWFLWLGSIFIMIDSNSSTVNTKDPPGGII